MKKIRFVVFILLATISYFGCTSKIKNGRSETFKVWGNCSMCKKTIEQAANVKNEVLAEWDKDTKIITLSYDSTKTNAEAILKRVADAGYDNEKFRAKDEAYLARPKCCHYKRNPVYDKNTP